MAGTQVSYLPPTSHHLHSDHDEYDHDDYDDDNDDADHDNDDGDFAVMIITQVTSPCNLSSDK